MARLKTLYNDELAARLQQELGIVNKMEVPRITKITLNMGVGEAIGDKKVLENAVRDLEQIAGQKAVVTLARKSIAGFKIREGWPIGCARPPWDDSSSAAAASSEAIQMGRWRRFGIALSAMRCR